MENYKDIVSKRKQVQQLGEENEPSGITKALVVSSSDTQQNRSNMVIKKTGGEKNFIAIRSSPKSKSDFKSLKFFTEAMDEEDQEDQDSSSFDNFIVGFINKFGNFF
jgi:hypothetical protein